MLSSLWWQYFFTIIPVDVTIETKSVLLRRRARSYGRWLQRQLLHNVKTRVVRFRVLHDESLNLWGNTYIL